MIAASCFAPQKFVDRSILVAEPAAKLRPPGVFELAHVGADRKTTIDGPQGAFEGYIFGTQTTEQNVLAYYKRELRRIAWQRDRLSAFPSSAETVAWGWCKDQMDFRLAIKDQKTAFQPDFYQGRTFVTVFDASLVSRDVALPCPVT